MTRIADVLSDGIVMIDATGKVIYWNAAATRMFGYETAEMEGQLLAVIMPKRYRARHIEALQRLALGDPMRFEGRTLVLEGLHRDGHEIPLELTLTPVPETGGEDRPECRSYIGVLRERREPERLAPEA